MDNTNAYTMGDDIMLEFKSGKPAGGLRYQAMRDYLIKLKWLADNPMQPVFISERSA